MRARFSGLGFHEKFEASKQIKVDWGLFKTMQDAKS